MHTTKTLKRHAALVDRMAAAQGLDLEETMLRGDLTTSQLEDMVLTCSGCSCANACETWLDRTGNGVAKATPSYCRNHETFAELVLK